MPGSSDDDLEIGFLERAMKNRGGCICPPPVILSAYAVNRLSLPARKAVRRHVSLCAECAGAAELAGSPSTDMTGAERADELRWETLRARLPAALPQFRSEAAGEASARVSAVKARIAAYRPAPMIPERIRKRRLGLPAAVAASFTAVVLLAAVILTGLQGSLSFPGALSGDHRGNVVVTASGVSEKGSIQIRQSPLQSPMTVRPVGPGSSKLSMRLDPGVYWVRVQGETSGSRWIPVKVELSGRTDVSVQSESNMITLSPSSPSDSLQGATITYRLNGEDRSARIDSASFEVGPLSREDSLSDLSIERGRERWRYSGAVRIMGGRQILEVRLRPPVKDDAMKPAGGNTGLTDAIDMVEKSTVKIETSLPSGMKGIATGFAVQHPGGVGIITSCHAVEGASIIAVTTSTGRRYDANLLASARDADLALLDVPAGLFIPPVSFGDSSRLRRGQRVFALGNPLNEDYSVCDGIVSKLKSADTGLQVLILSNRLNPGNSGSPLFLESGEVVGIVSAKLLATPEIDSMGVSLASGEIVRWLEGR